MPPSFPVPKTASFFSASLSFMVKALLTTRACASISLSKRHPVQYWSDATFTFPANFLRGGNPGRLRRFTRSTDARQSRKSHRRRLHSDARRRHPARRYPASGGGRQVSHAHLSHTV